MVALPLVKLLYMGVKLISKPIARQIKNGATRSPFFSKYVCMPPAQSECLMLLLSVYYDDQNSRVSLTLRFVFGVCEALYM